MQGGLNLPCVARYEGYDNTRHKYVSHQFKGTLVQFFQQDGKHYGYVVDAEDGSINPWPIDDIYILDATALSMDAAQGTRQAGASPRWWEVVTIDDHYEKGGRLWDPDDEEEDE